MLLWLAVFMVIFLKMRIDEKYVPVHRYPGSLDDDFMDRPYRQGAPFKYSNQHPGVTGLSVRGIGGPY
jgi:hypothetical protein